MPRILGWHGLRQAGTNTRAQIHNEQVRLTAAERQFACTTIKSAIKEHHP